MFRSVLVVAASECQSKRRLIDRLGIDSERWVRPGALPSGSGGAEREYRSAANRTIQPTRSSAVEEKIQIYPENGQNAPVSGCARSRGPRRTHRVS
jgi:hypothetical protein